LASPSGKSLAGFATSLGCTRQAEEYTETALRISQLDGKSQNEKWLNELRLYERACLALFEAMSERLAATRQGALL
jgi:hypothetical protein